MRLFDNNGGFVDASLEIANHHDLAQTSNSWQFSWVDLQSDDSWFYKVNIDEEIQGLIKLELENNQYLVLKNIEVSPSNFGSTGKYKNIAEVLMAFACLQSFKNNEGNYKGFLVFTSKGELISHYENKYGAELIFRERMIIYPHQGIKLIQEHLKIDLEI